MGADGFTAANNQTIGPDEFHGPWRGHFRRCRRQHDLAEDNGRRQIGNRLRPLEPPVQGCQRYLVLSGKRGARKTAAPELFDHLQTLGRGRVILLPGTCLDFHAPQHNEPAVSEVDAPSLPLTIRQRHTVLLTQMRRTVRNG
jgi:hypothetical protein